MDFCILCDISEPAEIVVRGVVHFWLRLRVFLTVGRAYIILPNHFRQKLAPLGLYKTDLPWLGWVSAFGGQVPPTEKNHFLVPWDFLGSPEIHWHILSSRVHGHEGILRFKRKSWSFLSRNQGSNFRGCSTFSSSPTSGAAGHTVHYQSFRG